MRNLGRVQKKKFALYAVALASAASPAVAQNLISNGDFSAGGTDWAVASNAFFFDGAYREGNVGDVGTISQTFAASAGRALTLSFDYGGNSGYQYVQFNGVDVAGSFVSNPSTIVTYTFDLGPALASNTLTFFGRNDPSCNFLDNVSVTAGVPEPATWALMILGFGAVGGAMRRRKVQTSVRFA